MAPIKRKIHRKRLHAVIHRRPWPKVISVQYQVQEKIPINLTQGDERPFESLQRFWFYHLFSHFLFQARQEQHIQYIKVIPYTESHKNTEWAIPIYDL